MEKHYRDNAAHLAEELLESTTDPTCTREVDYGDCPGHCWNGDQENGNHLSRLRYNTMYLPKILKRIEDLAPRAPT